MTDADRHLMTHFSAALDCAPGAERAAYLEAACGADADLRARVEALLRAHDQAGPFLERPEATGPFSPVPSEEMPAARPGEDSGAVIGPYKLLQLIGQGGMGTVWMAEQARPVQRKVALKLIKPGMDTRQVLARFEAERQALALMDHPNIAKVLDAGATEAGRPYFVMELVKGEPITRYCDEHRLTPRERLELFGFVCQAVQHAHQKGIIHRDIKPSNVLVAPYDGKPVVKVIDFGVVKATSRSLTEKTLFTEFGAVVGTPEYMSPEQAEVNNQDVDTRSDIYSLGVLLYELLTGTTPHTRNRIRQAAFAEMLRMIREEEPPKPSTRLSESANSLPSIAAQRQTEPAKLTRLVRGELDWIVMKALEKDRTRRYDTANGLARDIQRYLADEIVEARPPSAGYRMRKVLRRHRAGLTVAAVIAVLLVAGAAVSLWQAVRAGRAEADAIVQRDAKEKARAAEEIERKRAEDQRDRATKAETEANEQAAIARAVNDFLNQDVLARASPNQQPERDITLRKVLDRAAQRIAGRFDNQLLVEAAIRRTLGETYLALGEYDAAQLHLQKAADLYQKQRGDDDRDRLTTLSILGWSYDYQGKSAQALPLIEQVLAAQRRVLGEEDPATLTSLANLAECYFHLNQLDRAVPYYARALEARTRVLGEDHADTRYSIVSSGVLHIYLRKEIEAESLLRKGARLYERAGAADHPDALNARGMLGYLYYCQRKYDQAEPLLIKDVEDSTRILGPDHRDTFTAMHNLAMLYGSQQKFQQAEALYVKALAGRRRIFGEDYLQTGETLSFLIPLYVRQLEFGKAEQLLTEMLESQRRKKGETDPGTLSLTTRLALLHRSQGKHAEAQKLLTHVLELRMRKYGEDHPDVLSAMRLLVGVYRDQGQYASAETLIRKVLHAQRKKYGPASNEVAVALSELGQNLLHQKKWTDAEPVLRECLTFREKNAPDAWTTFHSRSILGEALLGQQKFADAEPLLVTGYDGLKARADKIPKPAKGRLAEAAERLVQLYVALGKPDEAARYRKELEALKSAK